jgi:hypothetical protein
MKVFSDKSYRTFWRELVEALIDDGWIPESRVWRVAEQRRWHRNTVLGVFQALDLETFQHEGETYWRLSDKVVPILSRREPVKMSATA